MYSSKLRGFIQTRLMELNNFPFLFFLFFFTFAEESHHCLSTASQKPTKKILIFSTELKKQTNNMNHKTNRNSSDKGNRQVKIWVASNWLISWSYYGNRVVNGSSSSSSWTLPTYHVMDGNGDLELWSCDPW